MSRRLIVGLGNPGPKYEGTRHNIGFEVADALGRRAGAEIRRSKFNGLYDTAVIAGEDVVLLKPQTFMNRSGQSVEAARHFFDVEVEDIIVLHDDIDLELGQLKVKQGGGHGGHNGLRDIVSRGGEKGFIRIRLGVGRPTKADVSAHVLGRFTGEERMEVEDLVERACDAIEVVLTEGVPAAQNAFH